MLKNLIKLFVNKKDHNNIQCEDFLEEDINYINSKTKTLFLNEYTFFKNKVCPNCGSVLDKSFEKSFKCPECKKNIFIKTDYRSKERLAISEDRLNDYQKLIDERVKLNSLNRLLANTQDICNISKKEFNDLRLTKTGTTFNQMFHYLNEKALFFEQKIIIEYNKLFKIKNQYDRWLETQSLKKQMIGALHCRQIMCGILIIENKDNVLISSLPRQIHTQLSYQIIENSFLPTDTKPNPLYFWGGQQLLDYAKRNNLAISDLKQEYKKYAGVGYLMFYQLKMLGKWYLNIFNISKKKAKERLKISLSYFKQHFLYFFPLPQGQGSLRPIFLFVFAELILLSLIVFIASSN